MRLTLLLLIAFLVCSCSKENEQDREAPSININSPFDFQIAQPGETIAISGMVEDNFYLQMVHVEIRNIATDEMVLHIHIVPTTKVYAINQPFVIENGVKYLVKVIAQDSNGNSSTKEVQVSCD